MKTIKTTNANVTFDTETKEFRDLNIDGSKTEVLTSKSELFRRMYDAGVEICEISKECESHYSFVYGVISNSREVRTVHKTSASDEIRRLSDEGLKPGDIAKQLNKNYSFVFGVVKKHNASKPQTVEIPKEIKKSKKEEKEA